MSITISISIEAVIGFISVIGSIVGAAYKLGYDIGKNARK